MTAAQWPEIQLGEITTKIGSGATPRGGKESYKREGTPLIRSMNVHDLKFDADGLAFLDDDQAAALDGVEVADGDVLLNITGASVARCCLAPAQMKGARVNQHVAIIRPSNDRLLGSFLAYVLVSDRYKDQLLSVAQAGATREALTKGGLEQFRVAVPPLPTQQRIAAILSAYDDLIENNTRRIAILEEMARRLYEEWFVHFRFPGHEAAEFDGEPPRGWEEVGLDELMTFQGGAQPPKSEWLEEPGANGVRMIQIRDYATDAHIAYVTDAPKLRRCGRMDIMIARYGASVGRVCWGLEGVYNVALVKVIPTDLEHREFLRSFLTSERTQALIIGMSGRAAQAGFNKSMLTSISLVLPKDRSLLSSFAGLVTPLRELQLQLKAKNANLRAQRDVLLSKLISGEIDVSGAENALEAAE